jgi:tetrahydromethanopterin S-methyltransferase subunit G
MSESESHTKVTTYLDDETHAAIKARLDYGDSKAEWVREACHQRLADECDTEQ